MIEDLESVVQIELSHDEIPVTIYIDIVRGQPVQPREFYWKRVVVTDEWITTAVTFEEEIPSRTTWNDGRHFILGYQEKWDHPINSIEAKLAAYQRAGYQIAAVRRREGGD